MAVGGGDADVAYGTDTGGSVRIPAACCGVAGLKTTWGRIPLDGVWPLSPSFDTVGPMARSVAGLVTGMELLEAGFTVAAPGPLRVGRLRIECDPVIDDAVDRALAATGWEVVDIELAGWGAATRAAVLLLVHEAWASDGALADAHPDRVSTDVLDRLHQGRDADPTALGEARAVRAGWRVELGAVFGRVDLVATPTLTVLPPTLDRADQLLRTRCTLPVNLAGVPALALPVPTGGRLPASLQLIGAHQGEERLLAAGAEVEAATA